MPSFADVILSEDTRLVQEALRYNPEINVIDEYGFTPLIEAAITDNADCVNLLLKAGADVSLKDMTGNTALHWAAENNNVTMAKLLLKKGANPNDYNLEGQPVGVLPYLRNQVEMKKLLEKSGANVGFIKDYINIKMLGHLFELVGAGSILSPNRDIVEVSFEGFLPEVTLMMIAESLSEFQKHFASRYVRNYIGIAAIITEVLHRAAKLIRYQQYRVDVAAHQAEIIPLLSEDPLVIPVCYEGHAITFIRHGQLLVKCDRREESRLFDNIMIYKVNRPERLDYAFIQKMIYRKQSFASINEWLPKWLELTPVTDIRIPAQISGNCSWANVEACIPALFYLLSIHAHSLGQDEKTIKQQAVRFFQEWREWNRDTSLQFYIQRFLSSGPILQATLAETLAAILFQACNTGTARDNERAERIITLLANSSYHYILQNYVRVWAYEDAGSEGRHFIRLLKKYGYNPKSS